LKERNYTLFKKIINSSFGVFTSRIFGLIRDLAVAAFFGASKYTDAFFVAFAIPNLFRALFAEGALSSAFLPILAENKNKGSDYANTYMTKLLFYLFILVGFVTLTIIIFSRYFVIIFLPGYVNDQDTVIFASGILKIVMPYLIFISLSSIFAGFLNLLGSYFIPYSSTALLNISMIAGAYIGWKLNGNIFYLAYGVFVGGLLQFVLLFIYSYYFGYKMEFKKEIDGNVKKTFLLIIPSIVGVGISQLNFTIGRIVASFLKEGSISYLYYANRLFQFPLGVFSIALSSVALAELSKLNTENTTERQYQLIDKSIAAIFLIILPATAGLIILSDEITKFIYQRNLFGAEDTKNTAEALIMYSIGLIFYSLVNLFTKVFHSRKDTKTPVKIAFISFIANLIFMLLFIKWLSHSGIALASTCAALVNSLLLYINIKDYKFNFKANSRLIIKFIFATLFMSAILIILKNYNLNVLIVIAISAISYFLCLKLLNINIRRVLK
jgi:putative peptidoglycan lipid II flippase